MDYQSTSVNSIRSHPKEGKRKGVSDNWNSWPNNKETVDNARVCKAKLNDLSVSGLNRKYAEIEKLKGKNAAGIYKTMKEMVRERCWGENRLFSKICIIHRCAHYGKKK